METHQPDHYRLLGVSARAGADEIKAAYRKLSRVFHPDRQHGSERAEHCFKQIALAYAELADADRRAQYDRALFLKDPLRLVDDPRTERALDVLDGVMSRLRHRQGLLPGSRRGRDLRVVRPVGFGRAMLGGDVRVDAAYETGCATCGGEGTTQPERNPTCHVCQGLGLQRVGLRRQEMTCGFCQGRGSVLLAPCSTCDGKGSVAARHSVTVTVPARCRDGTHLRVRDAGEQALLGGPPGDLIVVVDVQSHPLLRVHGDDLTCVVPVTWSQAALGARIAVPTLEGPEWLRIPPGTPSGRELRIAGRGLPLPAGVSLPAPRGAPAGTRKNRGDLRFHVSVDVPEHLGPAQADALRALEAALGPAAFAYAHGFARTVEALRNAEDPADPTSAARPGAAP